MPYFPKDLKRVLQSVQRREEPFGERRAVRIMYHLLLAIRHLKSHGIAHRDVKLDNVLLANVDTEEEAAVLTDFGMCFDLAKHGITDFKVMMPVSAATLGLGCGCCATLTADRCCEQYDGMRRGGAPIALAPEVRFLTEILDDFRQFVDEIWRF